MARLVSLRIRPILAERGDVRKMAQCLLRSIVQLTELLRFVRRQ